MGGEAHIVAGQAHRPQEILFGPMDEASIHLGEGVVGAGEAESHRPVELTDPDTLLDCEVLGRTDEEEAAEGALELAGPELEAGVDIEVHEIGRATRLNSSHVAISYAVFCLQ